MLERPLELEKSVGLRMVAAKRHPWRDRSKDHGETQEARQGCRQTRAPADVCKEGEAGRQAEGGEAGCENAEARISQGESRVRRAQGQDETGASHESGRRRAQIAGWSQGGCEAESLSKGQDDSGEICRA